MGIVRTRKMIFKSDCSKYMSGNEYAEAQIKDQQDYNLMMDEILNELEKQINQMKEDYKNEYIKVSVVEFNVSLPSLTDSKRKI